MTRWIVCLALVGCASTKPAPVTPTQPQARIIVPMSPLVCEAGAARVTFDGHTATYFLNGALVGTSTCVATAMAVFNQACEHSDAFKFLFASLPGPPALDGKSAQLHANGSSIFLACHEPEPQPSASPPPPLAMPPLCEQRGLTACGSTCCTADEQCINSPVGPGSRICVRRDQPPPVQ
jgi:hypothetical protein